MTDIADKTIEGEVVDKKVEDYGNDYTPPEQAKLEVELSAEELEKIGLGPKTEEKVEAKTEDAPGQKEEEKPRDDKGKFIPKSRFDEVNNKAKAKVAALENQIKAMAERLAPLDGVKPDVAAIEKSLDEKSEEYGKLLADGELPAAKLVLKEISKLNRQLGAIEAGALASTHAQESTHVGALEQLVDMYKENYPQFDDSNKELYSQDMVNFVADLQGRFELTGYSPAEALRQAVELTVAKFRLDEGEPVAAVAAKADVVADRKAASVDKALKAAKAQPSKLDKAGVNSDEMGMSKIDISTLTQEQFNKLPESTLSRLRGDLL